MAGKTLEEYFVSLGIKGQNVVLKNIKDIKKQATDLSKGKTSVNLKGKGGGVVGNNIIPPQQSPAPWEQKEERKNNKKFLENINKFASGSKEFVLKNIKDIKKQADALTKNKAVLNFGKGIAGIVKGSVGGVVSTPDREKEKQQKKEEKTTRQFSEGSKKFGNAVLGFTRGAESFDPVNTVKNLISAGGEAFSNITIAGFGVGNLPKGIAELTNTMVSMASGAIALAKSSAATQYGLSNRNETTRHYGGEGIGQGGMSRAQHSELIMTIAGSFGKIQKPLQETVNKLVESKNTDALARVAGGNWASTGTDKGWFLQQIANETAGLPPSIAQAIQNSMLKSNADLIQEKGEEKGAQAVNADWVNLQEDQNKAIYDTTATQHKKMMSLSEDINSMQIQMINTGVKFAGAISDATDAIKKLPEKIEKMNKAFDSMAEKIYKYSFSEIDIRRVSK